MNHGTVLETLVLHSWLLWSISHHDGNGNNFARALFLYISLPSLHEQNV